MKKLIICSAAALMAAGLFLSARDSLGQGTAAPKSAAHQVGLIDMAHVFKNYEKFKTSTAALQEQIKAADEQAKKQIDAMKAIQERMTQLQQGSPDYSKMEAELIAATTKLETFKKTSQLTFLRAEADIYKTVYLEVQNAVQQYAGVYKYTLIMRFNRNPVEDAENPQAIIQSMNRQVVYYRGEDDLTDPILNYLNDKYAKTSGAAKPRTATAPAGGPATR
ncbi:Outer membrane protein (OmpH-like) [Caulifigura coniformis]|uniref:Outer membrane protein (OmpH-like) n=1 Tax=Caulifigura coniformis TaxID=2527983 RepID=A0A517SKV4_9PLAN|nr:OmpH family outer membrane protein [Caulifigura coniformis]QDT56751.1 Outer membrane protein (OmpH-like) [Caulifigura coniformis]